MAKLRADYAGGCTDENVRPTINLMSLIETESYVIRLYAGNRCVDYSFKFSECHLNLKKCSFDIIRRISILISL